MKNDGFHFPALPTSTAPSRPRPTTRAGRERRYTDAERQEIFRQSAEKLNQLKALGLAKPGNKFTKDNARDAALKGVEARIKKYGHA